MWYRVRRKRKKVIAPAKPEAQAVIQLVVDDCFYSKVISKLKEKI